MLEIPAGLTVLEILPHDGATSETTKHGDRITVITWRKEIPPKASAEFVLRATNPSAGDLVWKAHQHFADGTVAEWVDVAGDKRPASITKLLAVATGVDGQGAGDELVAIEAWLKGYDAAFIAKDLAKLGGFYHPDVTVYEGGGINDGWADYRDRHLGPELNAFENLRFGHRNVTVSMLPGNQAAYVRSEYFLEAKMGTRDIESTGLATYVLIRDGAGWKIRHSHTSSRPRRPAAD